MRKILLVAWREFRHTALTKAFILAAVLAPLAIVGLMTFMPALMKTRLAPLTGTLAVVETSGRLGDLIGRKYTFLVTLIIMGGSTFVIGLIP